jgi:hypothetical protein
LGSVAGWLGGALVEGWESIAKGTPNLNWSAN